MANERWTYQVVEIKPGFFGIRRDAIQERLNQLGDTVDGWMREAVVSAFSAIALTSDDWVSR